VTLGGIDNAVITNMSGGWSRSFDLPRSGRVQLTLRMQVTQTSEYEANELSQSLVSIDGTLVGTGTNDFVAQIAGNGNGGTPTTTGFQLVTLDLGTRAAGSHTLRLGGFNNQKTLNDESTEILIDDVVLSEQ
jgi:butyrate kinase